MRGRGAAARRRRHDGASNAFHRTQLHRLGITCKLVVEGERMGVVALEKEWGYKVKALAVPECRKCGGGGSVYVGDHDGGNEGMSGAGFPCDECGGHGHVVPAARL